MTPIFAAVRKATTFEELMKKSGEDRDAAFKRLAKLLHPDKHPECPAEATAAFAYLTQLFNGTTKPAVTIGPWSM